MSKTRATLETEAKALFLPDEDIQSIETNAELQKYIDKNQPAEGCIMVLATKEMIDAEPEAFKGIEVGERIEISEVEEGEVEAPPVEESDEQKKVRAEAGQKVIDDEKAEANKAADDKIEAKEAKVVAQDQEAEKEEKDAAAVQDSQDAKDNIVRLTNPCKNCKEDGEEVQTSKTSGKEIIVPRQHTLVHGGPVIKEVKYPFGFTVVVGADGKDGVDGTGRKYGVGNGVSLHGSQNTPEGIINTYAIVY